MKHYKSFLLFFTVFISTFGYAQFTDVINSNRPGESQAAFSVGKKVLQAEFGAYGNIEKHDLLETKTYGLGSELTMRYGAFLEQLEFDLDIQYQKDIFSTEVIKRSDIRQTTFGVKYLFYDPAKNYKAKVNVYSWKKNRAFKWRTLRPAVGLYVGANLNLSKNQFSFPTEPSFSPKVVLITQNQFQQHVLVINVIADKLMTDYPSYGYVVTLTRGFNERWSGFVENQAYVSDFYSDGIVRLGAAFLIKQNIQIDASLGTNFKYTPSILNAGVGLSWRFDKNYQEVKISKDKKGKGKKGKKEKGEKGKKEKGGDAPVKESKKRRDGV
ncbi:MAG: transporter [Bacteroidota bacterium]